MKLVIWRPTFHHDSSPGLNSPPASFEGDAGGGKGVRARSGPPGAGGGEAASPQHRARRETNGDARDPEGRSGGGNGEKVIFDLSWDWFAIPLSACSPVK